MYFILAMTLGMSAYAANSPQNCLKNFLFPLSLGRMAVTGGEPVIVGDSIVETLANGSLAIHRPKATAIVAADGARCNGQAGADQGAWNFLANALKKRANLGAFSEGERNRLRIVAEFCWDLSPKLNDAIAETMKGQRLSPPAPKKDPVASER